MKDAMKEYCGEHDRFAAANGIELIEVASGRALARMVLTERQHNSIGTAHGGALFTLAATAFFAACNAGGQLAMGTNMTLNCLVAVSSGTLTAEAVEVSRSRKLAHATVRITDQDGRLIALFQGTAYVTKKPYPPAGEVASS